MSTKYSHPEVIESKGARIVIQTAFGETSHLYDVFGQYISDVCIDSTSWHYDSTAKLLTMDILGAGTQTALFLEGYYVPIKHSTVGVERFVLLLILDSLLYSDTINFTSESSIQIFQYENLYCGLYQNGVTTKLNGNLVIHTAAKDTFFGIMDIEGETIGSYANLLTDIYNTHTASLINGRIAFTAVKRSGERSIFIGRLPLPSSFVNQPTPRDE